MKSKKYLIIYLVLLTILTGSILTGKNFDHPKFELCTFIIAAILGSICIAYYFKHDNPHELYKVAFVTILCFGIICALIVPIADISDETEHLNRAELTSEGVIFPHWTGEDMGLTRTFNITEYSPSDVVNKGAGYEIPKFMGFFNSNKGMTVFETQHDTDKLNYTTVIKTSAFEQNPFFGYLPQAVGILIAKLFDLNVIWIMWLARLGNLASYAAIVSIAIKKTPNLKMPLFAVACIPIAIYQSASASIDSMIIGMGILAVAYFTYMLNNEITYKDIIIYSVICAVLGLCKLPYLAFIFLLLLIPKSNYDDKNNFKLILISILTLSLIGLIWSNYATPALLHSWRSKYVFVNQTLQIQYLQSNPIQILNFAGQIFTTEIINLLNGVFNFYNVNGVHYSDNYILITPVILLFLGFIFFAYPKESKPDSKTRIGILLLILVIYIATCFIQLLTWTYVGKMNLAISLRYFIPLLALIPAMGISMKRFEIKDIDKYSITFIVLFLSMLVISFAMKYY